jgi:hypothetical protein
MADQQRSHRMAQQLQSRVQRRAFDGVARLVGAGLAWRPRAVCRSRSDQRKNYRWRSNQVKALAAPVCNVLARRTVSNSARLSRLNLQRVLQKITLAHYHSDRQS